MEKRSVNTLTFEQPLLERCPPFPRPSPSLGTPTRFVSRNPHGAGWTHTTGHRVLQVTGERRGTDLWQSHRPGRHPALSSFGWKRIAPLGLLKATETTQKAAVLDISLCLHSEQEPGDFTPGTFPLPTQSRFYCLDLMKCRLHLDRPISGSSRRQ